MDKTPHIVMLGRAVAWEPRIFNNLQLAFTRSFCREANVVESQASAVTLKILSDNLSRQARISLGKVITRDGNISAQSFARGLVWAAELYPDVVIIPLGMLKPNSTVKASLEILANTRARIFAAVGHPELGQQNSLYPAAYPECIAVGCERDSGFYTTWEHKPDILMGDAGMLIGSVQDIQMGTSSATMLAAAEYLNHSATEQTPARGSDHGTESIHW